MSTLSVQQSNIGVSFTATILDQSGEVVDLSSATTLDFIFQRPDGTLLVGAGGLVTDGTDGKMRYTTVSGDLDDVGAWRYQTHIEIGSSSFYSAVSKFKVLKNLPV
jgi:hypothetical protein